MKNTTILKRNFVSIRSIIRVLLGIGFILVIPITSQAKNTVDLATTNHENNPEYHFSQGTSYIASGKWKESIKELILSKDQIKKNSEHEDLLPDILSALQYAYTNLHQLDKAYDCITTLGNITYDGSTTYKDTSFYHQMLGDNYLKKRDKDNAIKEYTLAIQIDPNDFRSYKALGETYGELAGDHDKAIYYLKKAIELNPQVYITYIDIGTAYFFKMMFPEAITNLQKAIDLNPNLNGDIYLRLANAHRNEWSKKHIDQDYKKAEWAYQQALARDSSDAYYYVDYGWFLFLTGKREEALNLYMKALAINPKNEEAHIMVGAYYYNDKNYDKAFDEYTTGIALKPEYPSGYYCLYTYYSEVKKDAKKAKENLDKYNDLANKDPFYVKSLSSFP